MRRRYCPDIARLGALCEANYLRLRKLVPHMDRRRDLFYHLHAHGAYLGKIRIQVTEVSRYTNTLLLEQTQSIGKFLNNPQLTVRVYHDARMAEVVSAVNHFRIAAVNEYPNRNMHLPDEKNQLNEFLSEWLNYCLSHGHTEVDLKPLS